MRFHRWLPTNWTKSNRMQLRKKQKIKLNSNFHLNKIDDYHLVEVQLAAFYCIFFRSENLNDFLSALLFLLPIDREVR